MKTWFTYVYKIKGRKLIMVESGAGGFGQDLLYDLRQSYAFLVSRHMIDIYEARKSRSYSALLTNIDDLHTVVSHKIKKKEKKEKNAKTYEDLRKDAIKVFNQNSTTYLGKSHDPQATADIQAEFKKMEQHLYAMMDAANMFGSNRTVQGL